MAADLGKEAGWPRAGFQYCFTYDFEELRDNSNHR